jgi:predicted SprT family Zn-dependent metalloprotease
MKKLLIELGILIVIGLFLLACCGCSSNPVENPVNKLTSNPDLYKFFETANNAYFGDRLPKKIILDWNLTEDNMAQVDVLKNGLFHISFNEKYCLAERNAHLTMYHEMCHIETWDEKSPETERHGPRWRTCMLRLDLQGAFRRELIDYYRE